MATGANISEIHSISDARTGSIRVSRLVLTGLANAAPTSSVGFKAWSDDGRMWGVYTQSSADLSFYRRPTAGSTDKVCSGTVSSGKVTLAQANSSGISGTADVDNGIPGTNPSEDSTLDVVVCYADENDLLRADRNANSLLASGLYPGGAAGTRWESILYEAKRRVDAKLLRMCMPRMRYDIYGRPLLAHIVNIGDLARVHAHATLRLITANRGRQFYDEAEYHKAQETELLAQMTVQFDYERDVRVDDQTSASVIHILRG